MSHEGLPQENATGVANSITGVEQRECIKIFTCHLSRSASCAAHASSSISSSSPGEPPSFPSRFSCEQKYQQNNTDATRKVAIKITTDFVFTIMGAESGRAGPPPGRPPAQKHHSCVIDAGYNLTRFSWSTGVLAALVLAGSRAPEVSPRYYEGVGCRYT